MIGRKWTAESGCHGRKKGEDRDSLHPHFFDLPLKSGEKTGFPVGPPLQSEIPAAFSRGRPKKPRTAETIRLVTTVTRKKRKSKEKSHFFEKKPKKNLKIAENVVTYMTCETVLPDHGQHIRAAVAWQHRSFEQW